MVEENILKLDIKRLREQLHSRASEVLTLEDLRLLLDASMKERCQDIFIYNDMLKAQIKCDEEERQKIRLSKDNLSIYFKFCFDWSFHKIGVYKVAIFRE